jgi:hypothetical protein
MRTYKLYKTSGGQDAAITTNEDGLVTSFLFDPDNTDYQTFKKEVLAGAELQDADGNLMTPEQAKTYVATLP